MLTISTLLLLNHEPANGVAAHTLLLDGLDPGAVKSVANHLGVAQKDLQALLGNTDCAKSKQKLSREVSNFLYRIARALVQLEAAMGGNVANASHWLHQENPLLKGRVPLLLLKTYMGAELVNVAISRMKPTPLIIEGGYASEDEEEPASAAVD